jgi:tetratricopeptide (TPR) repeat protein
MMVGDYEAAEDRIRGLLSVYPDYEMGWNSLGVLMMVQGRHDEAEEAFKKAISVGRWIEEPYESLGFIYVRHGRMVDAKDLFSQLHRGSREATKSMEKRVREMTIDMPGNGTPLYILGLLQRVQGLEEEAEESILKAHEYNVSFNVLLEDETDNAEQLAQEALRFLPQSDGAWFVLGNVAYRRVTWKRLNEHSRKQ